MPGLANARPGNYDMVDQRLAAQMTELPDDAARVETALALIRERYPTWESMYKVGIFDCSDMSEYVRWWLGKCGIKADYCQSDEMWHCWVEVPSGDTCIVVECTDLSIIEGYDVADVRYNRRMRPGEINWWATLPEKLPDGMYV